MRLSSIIKNILFLSLLFQFISTSYGQNKFQFKEGFTKDNIKFRLVNNLIIIPVELNGVELSFILDTGVGSTILFSLENRDSLELKNASKIFLKGFGNDEPIEAVKSLDNELKIGRLKSSDHTIFLVYNESINFSPRMGIPIHGIIGYDFFKNFKIGINYSRKVIKVQDNNSKIKNCKKCYETNLGFFDGKRPYIDVNHLTKKGLVQLKLLIDSGSGSGLWLFENEELGIVKPQNTFRDYLGRGFSGDIYGQRTKIDNILIGHYELREVTTSFPDSIYLRDISIRDRQGSIGGSVLKRFNVLFDYKNHKIRFKKSSYFDKPFNYNMSGLTIEHTGVRLAEGYQRKNIEDENSSFDLIRKTGSESINSYSQGQFSRETILVPSYEVYEVRPNSPSAKAGLKKGDVLIKINSKKAEDFTLSEINDLFYSEEGKKIKLTIDRRGVVMTFTFFLDKVI